MTAPEPPGYAELIEQIKQAGPIPAPPFDRIKLTREQLAQFGHGEQPVRPFEPPPWPAIPVDLVDRVEDSTPYELEQARLRAAADHAGRVVACAVADQERVEQAVAGLLGVEVRPVPYLDTGTVVVMDPAAFETSIRQSLDDWRPTIRRWP